MKKNLEVVFAQFQPFEQRVSWLILQATAKAWLIQTPGGELWVPSYRYSNLRPGAGATADERKMNGVVEFFENVSASSSDARVPVRRAGKGPTELSSKVTFEVCLREPESGSVLGVWHRSSLVPVSQLSSDCEGWSVPRWVLAKKLKPNESFHRRPVWPGMNALRDQLRSAFDAAAAGDAAARAAARVAGEESARKAAERAGIEAERKAERQAMVACDGEFALAYARRNLSLSDLAELGCRLSHWPQWRSGDPIDSLLEVTLAAIVRAVRQLPAFVAWRVKNAERQGKLLSAPKERDPRLPDRVISDCLVRWSEYVGPAKSMRRVDHCDEGCTVEVYGKKHLIMLPGGRIITKMAGPNLTVTERAKATLT